MPADIGLPELLILALVLLLVFGPSKLPEMGRQLGKGLRDFRGALTGDHDEPAPSASAPTTDVDGAD